MSISFIRFCHQLPVLHLHSLGLSLFSLSLMQGVPAVPPKCTYIQAHFNTICEWPSSLLMLVASLIKQLYKEEQVRLQIDNREKSQ